MTDILISEIMDKKLRRKDIARTYRTAMEIQRDKTDWRKVNQSIIDRWSVSALNYIKKLAWGNIK